MTKPMMINGFTFQTFQHDTPQKYYQAIRGDVVFKSKSLDYLIKKVKNFPQAS